MFFICNLFGLLTFITKQIFSVQALYIQIYMQYLSDPQFQQIYYQVSVINIQSVINHMERQKAERKYNSNSVLCLSCQQQFSNSRMFIHQDGRLVCYTCSVNDFKSLFSIKMSYKDFYYSIINKLPLPDYKTAKVCLQFVNNLRSQTNILLGQIKKQIQIFEKDLNQFYEQTVYICKGYIDKVKTIEQSSLQCWYKFPPKKIDQDKYIFNIKQKQILASKIQQSLKGFKLNIPNIEQIKNNSIKPFQRQICNKVSITAAINVRGLLYQGTNDGRIIYENGLSFKQITAHNSLIRAFAHDRQFKLFSGSDDQLIKIWDLRQDQPKLLQTFGSIPGIKSIHRQLLFVPNNKLASSRGQFDQYRIRVWDLNSLQNVKTLQGHNGYIRGMVINDRNQIISVSEDKYLKIWDLKSCSILGQYFHGRKIYHVYVKSQNNLICISDEDNKIIILDQDSLQIVNGIYMGKKIHFVGADQYIYVHVGSYMFIYTWFLYQVEKIDLGSCFTSTNIVQMGNKLFITDAHGCLHEHQPLSLSISTA